MGRNTRNKRKDGPLTAAEHARMETTLAEIVGLFAGPRAAKGLLLAHQKPGVFLLQRDTIRARVEDEVKQHAAALDEKAQEALLAPYLDFLEHELPELNRRALIHHPSFKTPRGVAWATFLRSSRDVLGAGNYHGLTQHLRALTFERLMFVAAPMLSISSDPKVPFEMAVRFCNDVLCDLAQQWYRPVLQAAVRLTYRARGSTGEPVNELGALMRQAAGLWSRGRGPTLVLDDDVRIVRNGTAHCEDRDIDARTKTVTFINRPRNAPPEQLGPLDRAQFHALLFQVVVDWVAMANILASFDRDET